MIIVRICGLASIAEHADFEPDYMVSILGRGLSALDYRLPRLPPERQFVFSFSDVEVASDPDAPTEQHMRALVDLGRRIAAPDSSARILIHCAAGISRSAAAGFIFFCIHLGPDRETEALEHTASSAESSLVWPNSLMVEYADAIMAREGRMISAVEKWKGVAPRG